MSCTEEISGFCSKFLSLNLSMSGSSGPTLDVSILGEPFSWDEIKDDPKSVSSSIIKMLNESNFPISGEWDIMKMTSRKSSSGVTTNIQMIDRQWVVWNRYQIGLTLNSGGDVVVGKEYFNVNGIPWGDIINNWSATAPRNILVAGGLYRRLYHQLNLGNTFINSTGGISYRPNNISSKDFIEKHVPGLPNPWTEFGEYYYNFKKEIVGHPTGVFSRIPFPSEIEGLFNESGSAYDVFSSIGARFGYVFIPTTNFLGFHKLTSDFGKLSVLTSAGISVPDDAESSSFGVDYGAGYTQESYLHVKSPGRERKEADSIISNDGETLAEPEPKRIRDDEYTSSVNDKWLWLEGFGATQGTGYIRNHFIWKAIKDTALIQEFGQAAFISNRGSEAISTSANNGNIWKAMYPTFKDLVDDNNLYEDPYASGLDSFNHQVFYGFASEIVKTSIDYRKEAAIALSGYGSKWTTIHDYFHGDDPIPDIDIKIESYMRNLNRFSFTDSWGTYEISEYGDLTPNYYEDTFGFRNFGNKYEQRGTKEYYAENEGTVEFIMVDTQIKDTPIFDLGLNPEIETINDAFSISSMLERSKEEGIILVYKEQNEIPEVNAEVNFTGYENLIDIEPSVRTEASEGKTPNLLGGVAAVNYGALEYLVNDLIKYVGRLYDDWEDSIAADNTKIWMTGLKEPETFYDNNLRSGGSAEKPAQVNESVAVNRQAWSYNCGTDNSFDQYSPGKSGLGLNRKIFNFNVDYAIHERPSLNTETGQIAIPDRGAVWYLDEQSVIQKNAYMDSCTYDINVPYLEKISFSLINKLYSADLKYLESANINVVGGKLIANYTFSQKVMAPDYLGLSGAKASLQNLLH